MIKELTTSYLAKEIKGKLIGEDKPIEGIFTFLNDAHTGDVVIRHWVDDVGVKIAYEKEVTCLVTQNPHGNSVKTAEKLGLCIIVTPKIELANAFALGWTIKKCGNDSLRIAVTGTNGKSTTTHMIHSILRHAGYTSYTNTDAKSEFNTLIDPVISKQIAEFENVNGKIDAMVIEVSEVQGWMDKLMHDHASLMISAIQPHVLVLTNVSLDHIGLVNSIEETYDEVYGSLKALSSVSNKHDKFNYVVLNLDDPLLMKMKESITGNDGLKFLYFGTTDNEFQRPDVLQKPDGIYVDDKLFLKIDDLPFKSKHFIQNTMAAIGACLSSNIDYRMIQGGVSLYKPLERRFTILNKNPLIIDDFAHNPDGISATIKSAAKMGDGKLNIIFAIRGSRGETINRLNIEAVVNALKNIDHSLIITSSMDEVDNLNIVLPEEEKIVFDTLKSSGISYKFHETLHKALENGIGNSEKKDTILLIGAQGMDPASEIIRKSDFKP